MNRLDGCLSNAAGISWQEKPVNMINKNIAENVKTGNIKQVNERGPITSWQIDGGGRGGNGNSDRFYFLELQNHCG